MEGFCVTALGGLYLEELSYTWKGLFSEFYGIIDRIINLLITWLSN